MRVIVDLIEKEHHGISLRVIDYLCTNYAKNHDVVYFVGPKKTTPFNLYLQYRAQLKAYSKMQFDPFRRHERINISVPLNLHSKGTIETTVAQLNFFRWAIDNKVIDFLKNKGNMQKVEIQMNTAVKKEKGSKATPRNKLPPKNCKVPSSCAKRHNIKVTVTFE